MREVVEHRFQGREVGNEFLDDFAEGFEDAVVVDGGEVEVYGSVLEAVVG